MNTLRFLLLSILAISIFIIYLIVTTTNPQTIDAHIKGLFFISVFAALTSLYALMFFVLSKYSPFAVSQTSPLVPLRQGAIAGVVVDLLLGLQSMRILSWLDTFFTIAAAILFEMFFRVRLPVRKE